MSAAYVLLNQVVEVKEERPTLLPEEAETLVSLWVNPDRRVVARRIDIIDTLYNEQHHELTNERIRKGGIFNLDRKHKSTMDSSCEMIALL